MLDHTSATLPTAWYIDPGHFQRELENIWRTQWVAVGRVEEWGGAGDYRVIPLAGQQVVVTQNRDGELRAFHNTCRHRGSLLCVEATGRFRGRRIVCPYHAWAYSLDGELLSTPRRPDTPDFEPSEHGLYPVALHTWGGFVFLNLAAEAPDFASSAGKEVHALGNWPLAGMVSAHREEHDLACNWKVFWENYSECYHCPGVHRDLCQLVPLYREGVASPEDLPGDHPMRESQARLADGKATWSPDGQTPLPDLPGLSGAELAAGMTFADFVPGMFVIAHRDHARSVRLTPLGPEQTRLTVDWLLMPETAAAGVDLERLTSFARQVVLEDARVCELNQAGLHCMRHAEGVLLPQERAVKDFDDWVRERLGVNA